MNAKTQRREDNTKRNNVLFLLLAIFASSRLGVRSTFAKERTPQFPPKTDHTLYTKAQLELLHYNIAKYPDAKTVADKIVKAADHWLTYSDAELIANIHDSSVPRDFDVSSNGCPNCGAVNHYSWIIDPKRPLTVQCPVCKQIFPNKDHPDNGWGWKSPNGKIYNFVSFANHWMMYRELSSAARDLARAYAITGDKRYSAKADLLLKRFAEVYPDMDYQTQSAFAKRMAETGEIYTGKIVNHIWETDLVCNLSSAYDLVFDTMPQSDRSFIEANLLEDAIDAYYQHKIQGNFGMHQQALVYLGLTRQFGPTDKWFDPLLNESCKDSTWLGLRYALYNLIYRDGLPMETSPVYNSYWVEKIAAMGELLKRTGRNIFEIPKTHRLFDGPLELVQTRQFMPDLGDSGIYTGDAALRDRNPYTIAHREYGGEKYNIAKSSFVTFDDLCQSITNRQPPLKEFPAQKPRLLDGYGLAVLNNPADTISMSLYYGLKGGHGHFDRLGFELFANNKPIMPDLGYPDAMNIFVPGIYTWSKNTVAHNTVTVDAHRQLENIPGTVHLFADSPWARVVQVDGNGTYPQCSQYQRTMVMVDIDKDHSYFVDFFGVAGGKQHDYSLHGPDNNIKILSGSFSAPASGTLAGENVPRGTIYDDPNLAKSGDKLGYSGYLGSGFQHLFNVQTCTGDDVTVRWQTGLTLHILNSGGSMFLADARVSPINRPELLKYLIARHIGDKSQFVSVIEPTGTSFGAQRLTENVVRVTRDDKTFDLIVQGPCNQSFASHQVETDASATVATFTDDKLTRLFFTGGTHVTIDGQKFSEQPFAGTITAVDPQHSRITIRTTSPIDDLVGRVVQFRNKFHVTSHPVIAARRDGDDVTLTLGDDLLVGLFHLDDIKPNEIVTSTAMAFAPCYRGTSLATSDFKFTAQVEYADHGHIYLANPLASNHPLKAGDDVWLMDAVAGDEVVAPAIFSTAP